MAYHELYDLGADLIVELALDGRARTTPGVNARSYFGWPDATTRREFGRRGGRFGRPFRLHPRLAPLAPVPGLPSSQLRFRRLSQG